MKKTEKIAGVLSVVAIICLALYLYKTGLVATAPRQVTYVVAGIFFGSILLLLLQYVLMGFEMRSRIKAFKELALTFSLEHTFIEPKLFLQYGNLNSLKGSIGTVQVEVVDMYDLPKAGEVANHLMTVSPGGHANTTRTKILIDGQDRTPDYQRSNILYARHFLNVTEIKSLLEKLK